MGFRSLWRRKKESKSNVPKEWQTPKEEAKPKKRGRGRPRKPKTEAVKSSVPSTSMNTIRSESRFKIRIPHLLTFKRILAGLLLIFNFFIAQAALTSAQASQPLYILFFANVLIILDYLWKTRRKTREKEKETEEWKPY